ncbi:MAG: Fe-S protein assembly co-chaperone HscB [Gammaproteobacteria bacterium]|nr:Fe-S protein assembly co-chaperone HscB [Gammaproteobacteria bacterium]
MIQHEKNYFELLGVSASFDLDVAVLSENYRAVQRALHPDRFANSSEKERRLSVQHAARINDAYNTLKSPLLRSVYLLGLRGVDVQIESNANMAPAFLMEQMELREALDDAAMAGSTDQVQTLLEQIDARERQLHKELSAGFEENSDAALQRVALNVRKLQFFSKLKHDAEQVEAQLDE